jgi:hypothetical protein
MTLIESLFGCQHQVDPHEQAQMRLPHFLSVLTVLSVGPMVFNVRNGEARLMKTVSKRGSSRRVGPMTWVLAQIMAGALTALLVEFRGPSHESPWVVVASRAPAPGFGPTIVNHTPTAAGYRSRTDTHLHLHDLDG